ncbi:ABC transporter permease [Bauldia sp.]|uniref:ABC transporter permease n=1 Tax=Bauldia sp. TaxID=2575872 RepID=UPI003BAA98AC
MANRPFEQAITLLTRHATLLIFVGILVYFGVQSLGFLSPENLSNVVKQASFIGIVAVGMVFVLLTAGIDLSVGSVMYLAPLIAGILIRDYGIGVYVGLAVAIFAGALMGAINAFLVVVLRIIPFIVTLSTLFFFRGFGTFLTGSRALDFPDEVREFGLSNVFGIPIPIIIFALVAIAGHIVLSRTTFGRQVYATGNDPEAARKAGINTAFVRARVYVICSACAGLGGYILIAQIGRLDTAFGEGREFDVIAAAVLGGASLFGGMGTAFSAVIGATMIQLVKTGLVYTGVNLYLQPMMQGGIILLAVFLDSIREIRIEEIKRRFIRPLKPPS